MVLPKRVDYLVFALPMDHEVQRRRAADGYGSTVGSITRKQTKDLSSQALLYFLGRTAALLVTFVVPVVLVRVLPKAE